LLVRNLILEYVQGGELFEYLVSKGRLSDAEAKALSTDYPRAGLLSPSFDLVSQG
jgi:hypothetical protein